MLWLAMKYKLFLDAFNCSALYNSFPICKTCILPFHRGDANVLNHWLAVCSCRFVTLRTVHMLKHALHRSPGKQHLALWVYNVQHHLMLQSIFMQPYAITSTFRYSYSYAVITWSLVAALMCSAQLSLVHCSSSVRFLTATPKFAYWLYLGQSYTSTQEFEPATM